MESLHKPYDIDYKWLLSSWDAFMPLLCSFVKQTWAEKIDDPALREWDLAKLSVLAVCDEDDQAEKFSFARNVLIVLYNGV